MLWCVRSDLFVCPEHVAEPVVVFGDAEQLAISIEHLAVFDGTVVYDFILDFDVLDEHLVDAAEKSASSTGAP